MAAPELRLKVTLDTSFLKGQISRLPLDFAGANVSIRPKFDRQTIVNEFRLLNRYIGGKKFNITIASNLEAEIENADRLVQALGRVKQAASGAKGGLPIGGRELSRTKSKGGFAAEEIKTLFGAAVQGGLIDEKTLGKTRDQMVTALSGIGRDSIAGLLNGLQSGNADLQKAAQMLGSNLISSFKGVLGIASPSREFKKIGEAAGQGFEQGLLSSMADAFDSLERQLGTKLQRLKAQAIARTSGALAVSGRVSPVQVADVTPRDYARIAGSGPRAALPPGVDRSAATTQEFFTVMDRIGLAMANFTDTIEVTTATMQGLKKVIAALNNRALLSNHEQYRLFAQSLTKGQLPLLTGAASQQLPMLKAAGTTPRSDALRPQDRLLQGFLARTTKLLLPQGPGASGGRSVFSGKEFREIAGNLRRPQIGPGTDLTVKSIAIKDLTGIAESFEQLRTPLLPPAGGTTASERMRQQLSALPPLTAPSIGKENAPLSRAAAYSLNKANQLLGLPMGPSSPLGSMGQFPMSGMMGRGSLGQFPVDPMLAVGGASAMGQKVAGPYPWSNTARSARGGYIPGIGSSLQFPMSGMMGPSSPLGRITPQSSMFAGGGGGGPGGGGPGGGGPGGGGPGGGGPGGGGGGPLGGMQFNVPQLPGSGLVREIGTEFAFAAKQVLLFGTAYKALAFLQGFPAQVGEAVGALQSFRNTLNTISPTAQEAAASSEFILNIVDKYNVPLQSARDGFTKLYASMAPTGFSGNEIRDLFTGISQAAATFGMSSDKVDRVTYAFAQMASKGQVMSEELKGQLGDVLPGAMGIFAKAAGFEGADAIQKFGKALEDGAFKGKPMRDLLKNVTVELKREFGPGAEGAARTYQGVMTRMANSTKLLYESFEPVAINFLNSVVVPVTGGLKTVTDGFKAFFTGQAAQTAGGSAFAKQLEGLRPTFEGIRSNITSLIPIFQNFGKILLAAGQVFLQIASNPFVGYLARVYLNVVALTTVINILNLRALIPFIANLARSIYSVVAFGVQCTLAGQKAVFFDLMVRTLGTTLRTFFAATAVGIILVGIGLIAEAFVTAGARADAARQKMSQFADSVKQLGAVGDVAGATAEKVGQQSLAARLQSAKALLQQVKSEGKKLTKGQVQELKNLQLTGNLDFVEVRRGPEKGMLAPQAKLTNLLGTQAALQAEIDSAGRGYLETQTKIVQATRAVTEAQAVQKKQEEESKAAGATAIDLSAGDDTKAADKARQDAERLASQQQQSAIDAANRQNALDKSRFEGLTALSEQAYRHEINLIDLVNEYRLNGLNSIEARQEKFQQDLQKIELKRIETVRKAQEQMQKAQIDYTVAQRTAGAAGAGSGNQAGGGAVFGDTGRTFNAKGWVHGHFQNMNKSALIEDTVDVVMKLLEQGVKPELSSGAAFGAGMGREQVTSLVRRGIESHKRYASGASAIDVFVPQGTPVPVPLSGVGDLGGAAGVTGSLARSTQLTHLDPKSKSGAARTMERRSAKAGGTAGVEQQDLLYKGMESGLSIINATTIALKERENLIAANINTIFPVAEQRLENDLMKMRNQLQLQGMPQEYIAFQEQQYKTTYEAAEAIKRKKQETMEYSKTVEALQAKQAQGKTLTSDEAESLRFYTEAIRQNDQALTDLIEKQRAYNIAALESAIASIKNADALKAQQDAIQLIDSNVESATGSYKNFIKEVAQGGDPAEALKKFQESIADQVLTVFLDYAFQPVEQFLKDSLKNMFGLPTEEKQRQETLAKLEAQLAKQERIAVATEQTAINTGPGSATGQSLPEATINQGFGSIGGASFGGMQLPGLDKVLENIDFETAFEPLQKNFGATLENLSSTLDTNAYSLSQSAVDYSANFKNVGDSAKKMAEDAGEAAEDAGRNGKDFQEGLGKFASGIGIAAGAIMGIAAGISQIKKGGTGNTLMGIGSIMASVGGAIGGFTKLFGANGGVAGGGWKPFPVSAFANGGMVKGPTLGLVGEGKYNEAIVPLPDGRSIPVQMRGGGGSGSRDLLANQAQSRSSPSVLSMSFQSTTINGVEYVDRAQLEAAMEETRRAASREGANKGASLAIDRLANSPSSRRRAGIR
jgi:tape measure domain-containing protein